MANLPVKRTLTDFEAGVHTVVVQGLQYSFPIMPVKPGQLPVPIVIDNTPAVTAMATLLGKLIDTVSQGFQKIADAEATSGTPPATTPPAVHTDWLSDVEGSVASGGSVNLPAGTETASTNIGVQQTITGKGMRVTVLDGQYGVGAGHKLSWGKGVLHIGAPSSVHKIGIVKGGKGDHSSDGEAGVYCEWTGDEGFVLLDTMAFDDCENGVFMPDQSLAKVHLTVQYSVFGRLLPNGLDDGRSHDMYVAGLSVILDHCLFSGTSLANTIKCRGPELDILDSWIGRTNGRWIDCPGHTVVTSRRNVYFTTVGSGVQNALGFFDENDGNANPGKTGSFTSQDDTFFFTRFNEVIWINSPDFKVQFINSKVYWVGGVGTTPPQVTVQGPGGITGQNPFVFTEINRVESLPPLPSDPQ